MKKLALVLSFLCLLFFWQIGFRPLANPDEGRYAEIGREIIVSGDLISPRLNGVLYFEKPMMSYWITALGEKLFGVNLFGARFFNSLVALLTCVVVYSFCARFFNRRTGLIAAILLATSALFFGMSQMLTTDGILSFFVVCSLIFFARAFMETDKKTSDKFFLLAYVFMGLSVHTKGFIGIILPGIVGLPWLFYTGFWRKLYKAHLLKGLFLVFLINLPWHYLVASRHETFCKFYFWHEQFERYFTSVHNRSKQLYFLPLSFLIGLFPWVVFLPRAIIFALKDSSQNVKNTLVFGLFWSAAIVLFFSFSQSQLIPYILPALPGAIIVIAYAFANKTFLPKCKIECFLLVLIYAGVCIALPKVFASRAVYHFPNEAIVGLIMFLSASSVIALLFLCKNLVKHSFCALFFITIVIMLLLPLILPYFQRLGTQELSNVIKANASEDAEIFCANVYCQDLPFYLGKTVGTIDHVPQEQFHGYSIEGCSRYISRDQLKKRWMSDREIYLVVVNCYKDSSISTLGAMPFYVLYQNEIFTLYSNHK